MTKKFGLLLTLCPYELKSDRRRKPERINRTNRHGKKTWDVTWCQLAMDENYMENWEKELQQTRLAKGQVKNDTQYTAIIRVCRRIVQGLSRPKSLCGWKQYLELLCPEKRIYERFGLIPVFWVSQGLRLWWASRETCFKTGERTVCRDEAREVCSYGSVHLPLLFVCIQNRKRQ